MDIEVSSEMELTANSPLVKASEESVAQEEAMTMSELLPDIVIKTDSEQVDSALAPSTVHCTEETECDSWQDDVKMMDDELRSIERPFKYLLNKAKDFQNLLVCRRDYLQNECFARVVPTFLHVCQPFFSYLESTARSSLPQYTPQPMYIRSRLLDFSQQLCACLEKLVLTYANNNFFSLDESKPESISHFYIGQCQIDSMMMFIFRYCQPVPYLVGVNTGLYKRMRWNVERPRERPPQQEPEGQTHGQTEGETAGQAEGEIEGGTDGQTEGEMEDKPVPGKETAFTTEYYFLCYEDVPEKCTEGDIAEGDSEELVATGNVVRMWYIGQWVQTLPDPETEDVYDWIVCEVPEAHFHKLVCLGGEEPSACTATDRLYEALLCLQSPVVAS